MHPHNLTHSVAARLDILSHSTKLSLHGTCLSLFPVWLVDSPSRFHPNLTASLTKLGNPPNLLNLGVGLKPSKPLASPNARAGQTHSLRVMWLGPITDAEQMPTCSRWTWPTDGHPGSPWDALIRPLHLSPPEMKGRGSQVQQNSSRFHTIPSHPESGQVGGWRHDLPFFCSYSVITHMQRVFVSRLTNLTLNAII